MTNNPTDFAEWLKPKGLATQPTGEDSPLRYELRDGNDQRRLKELYTSWENESNDNSQSIIFSESGAESRIRYRYEKSASIKKWCTWTFPVHTIRGQDIADEAYHFEISASEPHLPDNSNKDVAATDTEVKVPLTFFEQTPLLTREFRVAGMDDARETVQEFLQANGDTWGLSPEHGLLLSGPPGTGKTEVVMEVCRELFGSVPVKISGPEILSRWVGESERILRKRFEAARDDPSGVLYIDELDAIARSRGEATQEHSAQIVAQLLVLLDGLDTKQKADTVKVIASTNLAGVIDEALRRPGRLGRTKQFGKLNNDDAAAVLHHYLDEIRHHATKQSEGTNTGQLSDSLNRFVTDGDTTVLTNQGIQQLLTGRTGAEIEQIVQQATRDVTDRDKNEFRLTTDHLEKAADQYSTGKMIHTGNIEEKITDEQFSIKNPVIRVKPDRGRDKIKQAFEQFLAANEFEKGEFRDLTLDEEMAIGDATVLRRRIWEKMSPDMNYPVCVYFDGFGRIEAASSHSHLAEAVIEVLCDRLIAPPRSNEKSKPVFFGYPSGMDSDIPRLEDLSTDPSQ